MFTKKELSLSILEKGLAGAEMSSNLWKGEKKSLIKLFFYYFGQNWWWWKTKTKVPAEPQECDSMVFFFNINIMNLIQA